MWMIVVRATVSPLQVLLIIYYINLLFRMRAEWIPQGYGIRSARIRNAFRTLCGMCGRYIIVFLKV